MALRALEGSRERSAKPLASIVGLLLLLTWPARAAEIVSTVTAGILQTDNVRLSGTGQETSQTILQMSPDLRFRGEGARLQSSVDYVLNTYYYSQLSSSRISHQLNTNNQYAVSPQHLYVDFGGSYGEALRVPQAGGATNSPFLSNNVIDRWEYYVGPRFDYGVGSFARVLGQYRRNWVNYESRPEYVNDTFNISVDNHNRRRGLSWALRYNGEKTENKIYPTWEYRRATVELGTWATESLRLFASGGKESAWDRPFDPTLADTFWEAGFAYEVGDTYSATFAAGERTFGSSQRMSLRANFSSFTTSLTYDERPTTEGRRSYSQTGSLDPDELPDYLSVPGRGDRYISKRFDWLVNFGRDRTNLSLNLFTEERVQRYAAIGIPLPDEYQRGVSARAAYRLGSRTTFSLNAFRAYREYETGGDRIYTNVSFTASMDFGLKTTAWFEFSVREDKSESLLYTSYRSNLIALRMRRTLLGSR